MRLRALLLVPFLVALAVSGSLVPARAAEPPFHELWRADSRTGFDGWTLSGVRVENGRLTLDPSGASADQQVEGLGLGLPDSSPGSISGLAVAPIQPTSAQFHELIPSWNAATPPGTWIEVRLRANIGEAGHWTRWYELGSWSTDAGQEHRRSVKGQQDADGRVSTDTLILKPPANAYQLGLILRADDRATANGTLPTVSLTTVVASTPSETARAVPSNRAVWGTTLPVPERSQMVYPNGGPVWCSPTSTSMVMAYWSERLGEPALNQPVPAVAAAVYDDVYRGNGNWPFNTAYAAQHGLVGYVSRMSSLAQVERWIEAGIPVIASVAWEPGQLPNAAVPSTDGHLLAIVGFTSSGDVVVNDPAADPRLGLSVRRIYPRDALERIWLTASGGAVYLIYPETTSPPPNEVAFGAW